MNESYLIIGASSDIGVALIKTLPKNCEITAHFSKSEGELSALKEEYENLSTIKADLTKIEEIEKFTASIADKVFSHFVFLPALRVINAKFSKFDTLRFGADINLQIHSAVEISKAVLPKMAKAKFGRVLFMLTSYIVGVPPKNTTSYVAVKSALKGIMRSLATDYAASGVTVNAVSPYMIETKFLADTSHLVIEASAMGNPMKRNATIDDVVNGMQFFLSEQSSFITGVNLPINGGASFE